jgi:5-methyltetrahydropteroyltriglutamate--homocysteine methyltransferase
MQQTNAPRIQTTVVGSYPVPDWLAARPSEQALVDATRVVIHIQEQAGIDLVCDGELSRFDVNHPETSGMIEYFVRPMAGIRTAMRFDELVAYRAQSGMGFRARPPAVVEGPVGPGTLDLPQASARAKRFAARPFKFTLTGPHMLAKTLVDHHYGKLPELALALGAYWSRPSTSARILPSAMLANWITSSWRRRTVRQMNWRPFAAQELIFGGLSSE